MEYCYLSNAYALMYGLSLGLAIGLIGGCVKKDVGSIESKPESKKETISLDEEPKVIISFKDTGLTRSEEYAILSSFRYLEGMNYFVAQKLATEKGYSLKPIYCNYEEDKLESSQFDKDVLGVRVDNYPPTEYTSVLEIIDVGGIDLYKRGVVHT